MCGSVNVATTGAGINMDAVGFMGQVIKETAAATADESAIGCAKLVVFANAVPDNPHLRRRGSPTVPVGSSRVIRSICGVSNPRSSATIWPPISWPKP